MRPSSQPISVQAVPLVVGVEVSSSMEVPAFGLHAMAETRAPMNQPVRGMLGDYDGMPHMPTSS
jgi:hypothetical protein